jgi:Zinc carboxypeptidase
MSFSREARTSAARVDSAAMPGSPSTPSALARARLAALSTGFRSRYIDHVTLTGQLEAWAAAFPSIARLESIGRSPEGRDVWMLTLGTQPERARPGVWVDGNMHAGELAGCAVALAIAEDVLALHLDPEGPCALPPHLLRVVQGALVYVVPRISPDGAEAVLTTGRYVRSVPRDGRTERAKPRWIGGDVDGDGQALWMRRESPLGDFTEHPEAPGLLVPRAIDDTGPFYELYPEGHIEHFDGDRIPAPSFLSDNDVDLNRNFPFHWKPEPEQAGAGNYPGSEPETRAVIDRALRLPHLFVWLNLHTFGGCHIRPPGDVPDSKMAPLDLGIYKQLGRWADELTGYPMVSGYQEFLYEPDKPLFGSLSEWAYEHRGALAWVTELWDLFARVGLSRPAKFVDLYTSLERSHLLALHGWDRAHNQGRIFRPWVEHQHPQLGRVQVGGIDRRVGLYNPSLGVLPEVCEKMSAFFLRVAALIPQLTLARVETVPLSGATQLAVEIQNRGYLPTHGMDKAKNLPWNEPLYADLEVEGCSLDEPGRAHLLVGHLAGWGKGLGAWNQAIFYAATPGNESSRTVRWTLRGKGSAMLRVGSPRVGWLERKVIID